MKRALVFSCIVLGLLPVAGSFSVTPAAAQPARGGGTCQNFQLLIRAQGSQGAAGTIAIMYRIHNLSGQTCSLTGYPGAQLLDRRFLSLPTTVHRGGGMVGSIPVQTVRLAPSGNAYFALFYSDVPVGNQPCHAQAPYIMITAPNDLLPVVTFAAPGGGPIASCTGDLHVSPVERQPRY